MCTVLYMPQTAGASFASLRDESPQRLTAIHPALNSQGEIKYIAPVDALAGGTWLGVNALGHVIILLNGGFKAHKRQATYRKSRGLIVTELLQAQTPIVDWELMDLENIEPFLLVLYCKQNLFELVWDGVHKHRKVLNQSQAYIWSSSTLYAAEAKTKRSELFHHWMLSNPLISAANTLEFFRSYRDVDNGYLMNRMDKVKTLSYSFIQTIEHQNACLDYLDFKTMQQSQMSLALNTFSNSCSLL